MTRTQQQAELIKAEITMPMLISAYLPNVKPRHNAIPCPIHNGENYNFSFKDGVYNCFVCHAHGTVIDFVKDLFGLPYVEALNKITADFGLPNFLVYNTASQKAEMDKKVAEAIAKRKAQQKAENEAEERYNAQFDRFARCDIALLNLNPRSPEEFEEMPDEYFTALGRIDLERAKLQHYENELYKSKRGKLWTMRK